MSFIGDLFGGSSAPKVSTKGVTKSFSTPAYSLNKGTLTPTARAASPSSFAGIYGRLGEQAQDVTGLRSSLAPIKTAFQGFGERLRGLEAEVRPGFGRLTEARVKTIRDASAAAVGDLRTQMQRRGVLGSSFGQDAETRTRLAFAQEEESARSEAILQEIGMSADLIKQQIGVEAANLGITEVDQRILQQSVATYVAQANVLDARIKAELNQLGVAGNITNQVSSIMMEGAIAQAKLDLQQSLASQSAMGSIFGTFFGAGMSGKLA